jgi:hypothetical protein
MSSDNRLSVAGCAARSVKLQPTNDDSLRMLFVGACLLGLLIFLALDWMAVLIYLFLVGGFQIALTLMAGTILAVVKVCSPTFQFVRAMCLFALLDFWLLAFGLIGDLVWVVAVHGNLYTNPDPLVDWLPFVLPGEWTIDPVCHGALKPGVTWWEMYLAWLLIAAPVWTLTFVAYRRSRPWVERRVATARRRASESGFVFLR